MTIRRRVTASSMIKTMKYVSLRGNRLEFSRYTRICNLRKLEVRKTQNEMLVVAISKVGELMYHYKFQEVRISL